MNEYPPTPEHDKLKETLELSEFTQRLGDALDRGTVDRYGRRYQLVLLMTPEQHTALVDELESSGDAYGEPWIEAHEHVIDLSDALGDLMGVDYEKLMAEKDAVLEYVRSQP